MSKLITQLLLLKWLSLWFIWMMNPPPDTWPGAGLYPQIWKTVRYHSTWRWVGRAEWSESACDALTCLKNSGPLVADGETYQVVMCLWGGFGTAGSGSGPVSGCGWSAGRTPCLQAQPVLKSPRSRQGCRGPQHTDWCSSQLHVLDCWCCSRCWMTEMQKSTLAVC